MEKKISIEFLLLPSWIFFLKNISGREKERGGERTRRKMKYQLNASRRAKNKFFSRKQKLRRTFSFPTNNLSNFFNALSYPLLFPFLFFLFPFLCLNFLKGGREKIEKEKDGKRKKLRKKRRKWTGREIEGKREKGKG